MAALNDRPQGSHGLRTTVTVLYSVAHGRAKKVPGTSLQKQSAQSALVIQKYASVQIIFPDGIQIRHPVEVLPEGSSVLKYKLRVPDSRC